MVMVVVSGASFRRGVLVCSEVRIVWGAGCWRIRSRSGWMRWVVDEVSRSWKR